MASSAVTKSRHVCDQTFSHDEMVEEQEHFKKVINAFLYYRSYTEIKLQQVRKNFNKLPALHQQMLPSYLDHWKELHGAADTNYQFVKAIIGNAVGMFENSSVSNFDSGNVLMNISPASNFYMDKTITTIKQFYRDWSEEGAKERDLCYKPIIDEILRIFPPDTCKAGDISILVPGAGLGRLAFEIAQCGYSCQGNEFSIFMLLGSNFILNQCKGVKSYSICPWIHQYSNLLSYEHQMAVIKVPDISPSDIPSSSDFSMSAGDFLEVYTFPDEWDCIACCFFIDTAHNVIKYLEKIYHILKPGGFWINFGPLLYHFADMPNEFSVELSWEDIRRIAVDHIGFEIVKEFQNQPSFYIHNPNSMMEHVYKSVFMVARKPTSPPPPQPSDTESHNINTGLTKDRGNYAVQNLPSQDSET